jgi:hypothetical protein
MLMKFMVIHDFFEAIALRVQYVFPQLRSDNCRTAPSPVKTFGVRHHMQSINNWLNLKYPFNLQELVTGLRLSRD